MAQPVPKYAAIFVLARANAVSGGPDALHRLVHTLNELGAPAYISYVPLGVSADVPEVYRRYYQVPARQPADAADNLILLPEAMSDHIRRFRRADKALWWLSVDHFFGATGRDGQLRRREIIHGFKSRFGIADRRANWPELRKIAHYSPSAYAATFLRKHRIESKPLHDPVNAIFLRQRAGGVRRDAIAYNPAKGMQYTRAIIDALPGIEWVALQGMSHEEVRATLGAVKIYLDFGYFPGRERLPSEAALCGACVVAGRRGAAVFDEDLMIPENYKIDPRSENYVSQCRDIITDIFTNFERRTREFDGFRDRLRREPTIFRDELISNFFCSADNGG